MNPRFTFLLILLFILIRVSSWAIPVPAYESDVCNNVDKVNQQMLQLELCPKEKKPKDSHPKTPEFVLPENRTIKIISQKWDDTLAQMTLSVQYLGKKDGRDVKMSDEMTYRMNFGSNRIHGCASVISDFQHFVMRESCMH